MLRLLLLQRLRRSNPPLISHCREANIYRVRVGIRPDRLGFLLRFINEKKITNMEIKAADVMKLRKMTGAGMMDCKKALQEAEGDFERAKDIIREKGKLVVAKRSDRTATEGVVVTKIVGEKAYILCLACETDFVAQNVEFGASAEAMLEIAVAADAADRDALMAVKNAQGNTVEEMVTEKSGQTGEKVEIAFYARIEAPYCVAYVHFNKKLGTVLGFNKVVDDEVARKVAMQATAMAPISIDENDCPAEVVEKEKAIQLEMMKQDPKNANKPEAILEQIATGKMRKFYEENTLLNQAVVGEKESIREFIQKADKEATVVAYKRFALEA